MVATKIMRLFDNLPRALSIALSLDADLAQELFPGRGATPRCCLIPRVVKHWRES